MPELPEQKARRGIDAELTTAGWLPQGREETQIKDQSLTDTVALPPPDVLAGEIAEDLEAALEQFAKIASRLS
jgi:hypothetical protein